MPTKRRRSVRRCHPPVSVATIALLQTGMLPEDSESFFDVILLYLDVLNGGNAQGLQTAWHAVRDDVIADWIARFPGTRPFAWWHYDAVEPRRRLGGTGDLMHPEHVDLRFGIPHRNEWVEAWMVKTFAGFTKRAPDPQDPPRFESQAAYLQRHALLSSAERRVLTLEDFEPERIVLGADVVEGDDVPEGKTQGSGIVRRPRSSEWVRETRVR